MLAASDNVSTTSNLTVVNGSSEMSQVSEIEADIANTRLVRMLAVALESLNMNHSCTQGLERWIRVGKLCFDSIHLIRTH